MMLTIGVCSDTHGGVLPTLAVPGVCAVLHAGDVYDGAAPDDLEHNPVAWAEAANVPVLAVRGNHDARDPAGFFSVGRDLTGIVHKLADRLYVAGIGFAAKRYFDLPGESDLVGICRDVTRQVLRRLRPEDRLILLTHYPPDVSAQPDHEKFPPGWIFRCITDLVHELKPVAVVQGHVHEWFGRAQPYQHGNLNTLIVNPGPTGGWLSIDSNTGAVQYQPKQ